MNGEVMEYQKSEENKKQEISRKQASDNRVLAKIKAEMTPICVICGKWGANDLNAPTSTKLYPQHKINPQFSHRVPNLPQ